MPSSFRLAVLAAIVAAPWPATAEPPAVVADIPPIHSIAARIMDGIAEPALLMPPGASPHHYALRPSEAQLLQESDLVIWVGPALTTWLAEPIAIHATEATVLEAMAIEGIHLRDLAETHDDDHGHEEEDHDHGGGTSDPHVWLDPDNAGVIAEEITRSLAARDPENADAYASNLTEFERELEMLVSGLEEKLSPLRERPYVVFHDAYGYFEDRFGMGHAGALSLGDADQPGAAHIREISERIRNGDIVCIFSEPQFSSRLVETVIDGTEARSGVVDPLGAESTPGPTLYSELLGNLARDFSTCLAPAE